jgi:UDP-N-acetylmuramoylalanine-D-glutamate ligase
LFGRRCRRCVWLTRYAPSVLAVTGTNGKTTVTALTGQLVERAGKTVAVAGNIGPTLLDTLTQCIDAHTLPEVWVLELSSFQLAMQHLRPVQSLNPLPLRCSTSPRTIWTGMAPWPPMCGPRPRCLASTV